LCFGMSRIMPTKLRSGYSLTITIARSPSRTNGESVCGDRCIRARASASPSDRSPGLLDWRGQQPEPAHTEPWIPAASNGVAYQGLENVDAVVFDHDGPGQRGLLADSSYLVALGGCKYMASTVS
jgi:hypothetical protein